MGIINGETMKYEVVIREWERNYLGKMEWQDIKNEGYKCETLEEAKSWISDTHTDYEFDHGTIDRQYVIIEIGEEEDVEVEIVEFQEYQPSMPDNDDEVKLYFDYLS